MTAPADHHQVGARGVAGEHAGGMPADDVLADPNFRVLAVPLLESGGQVAARLGRDLAGIRRPQRRGRQAALGAAGSQYQVWTATRSAPRSAASSNANASVPVPSSGSRMPTAISRCTAVLSSRTTTSGQGVQAATYRLTEPSIIAANPPAPRAPTTSMEAPEPQSATATAAGPDSKPVSMGRPGATSSDRMTAASSVRAEFRAARRRSRPGTPRRHASAVARPEPTRSAAMSYAVAPPEPPTPRPAATPPTRRHLL